MRVLYQILANKSQNISAEDAQLFLDSLLLTLSQAIPRFRIDGNANYWDSNTVSINMALITGSLALLITTTLVLAIALISPNKGNFLWPLFSTIPARSVPIFRCFLEIQAGSALQLAFDNAQLVLDSESTFDLLDDKVLLVDSQNIVMRATAIFVSTYEFESGVEGQTVLEVLARLTTDEIAIDLPPHKENRIQFLSGQAVIEAVLTPVDDVTFCADRVAYIVCFRDVTKLNVILNDLALEKNRVHMLIAQFVPTFAIGNVLSNDHFPGMMVQKAIASFVCISGMDSCCEIEDFALLQALTRSRLAQYRNLTLICRSAQIFSVISGLNDSTASLTEQSVDSIMFAWNLMDDVKKQLDMETRGIAMHIAIHVVGPVYGALICDPPYFELNSVPMGIPALVASRCSPNQVNITRDVYTLVIGLGFNILFENEVKDWLDEEISVHCVRDINV
jgi:hypothetical protein